MKINEYAINKKIKSLYFKNKNNNYIAKKVNLRPRQIKSFITNNKLCSKKDRYYRFLVYYAYAHNEQICDVAKRTEVKISSLTRVKRKYKIQTKRFNIHNKRITSEIKQQMIDSYLSGSTTQEAAEKFGYRTSKTVEDVLHEFEVKCRPPRFRSRLNYDYFKQIDSHDKAYILGLLYTDGYIFRDYEGFCIQLTESDGYLLSNIAKKIGEDVTVIPINCDSKRKHMPNVKDMVRLGVYSKELAEQVRDLGVIRNKTYYLKVTDKLSKKYIYSFMRGVIDGDGTISIYKNRPTCVFSTKSLDFAKSVCELPFEEKLKYYVMSNGMFLISILGGKAEIYKFLKKIYENKSDLFLKRKYEKVQSQIS